MNPAKYVTMDPFIRKEALKDMMGFLGFGMSMLGMAELAGAKVGTDWTSSDFGKIQTGKTRIDVWGGFQQYVRMFGQLWTGKYTSSITGKAVTLGEGYRPLTKKEILYRQVESKEAPIISFVTNWLEGKSYGAEKFDLKSEIAQRFIPMAASDVYDIITTDPRLLPISGLGLIGFGMQTYKPLKKSGGTNKMPSLKF
jgi:hypothetical protein